MKWSICLPSYNNYLEVYFTIDALLMYHDFSSKEIIVCDNYGDKDLKKYCERNKHVHYVLSDSIKGVSHAKNTAIQHAQNENVLCMDSHIFVGQGSFDIVLENKTLTHGAMISQDNSSYVLAMRPEWRANMWGVWADPVSTLTGLTSEIWAHGAGFLMFKRDSWLGFNKQFRGWGGETGYIQEKYRKNGYNVVVNQNVTWKHMFYRKSSDRPYSIDIYDRIRNYYIGFNEIGLDTSILRTIFGDVAIQYENKIKISRI